MADELAKLEDWVADGLITEEQAQAIRAREAKAAEEAAEPRVATGRVSLATEAVGYLGGGLAVIAAVLFISELWPNLQPWSKVAFTGIITAVLAVAGALIRSSVEPAVRRLSSFLWFVSSAGVAFLFGLFADDVLKVEGETVALIASASVASYSFVLWLVNRTHLQQIALFAGTLATGASLVFQGDSDIDPFFVGLVVWALGLAWGLLAWADLIRPSVTGVALGSVALLVGAQVASFDDLRGWGLGLGILTAVGLLAAGIVVRRTLLLGFGAAGVIIFVPQTVFHFFGDTVGAPLALLISGLVLVIGAVATGRLRSQPKAGGGS